MYKNVEFESVNSIIVCAAAIYGYTWAKEKLGPADWRNNGSFYEEIADVFVCILCAYFSYMGANCYFEALEERLAMLNLANWFEMIKLP